MLWWIVPAAERRLVIESGSQSDGMVYLSVQDNGSGISDKSMEHLFDPFFSTKESGMGWPLDQPDHHQQPSW